MNIAFIGLGVMGYPMAGHLQMNQQNVVVYNRTPSKAQKWKKQYHGQVANTPKDAALNAKIIFVCVGNDRDVSSVINGPEGILAGASEGSIIVDHTTTSAELSQQMYSQCLGKGINFIDAPVSGGQAGAENAKLTIMCGGDQNIYDQITPLLSLYAKQTTLMGRTGQGQRCKMVNQVCIAGILQGLSEALILAQKSDLDIDKVVDTLQHGAAGSWQLVNRLKTMSEDQFDFGFAIDWMVKDLGICLDEAIKNQLDLPMTTDTVKRYQRLQSQGLNRLDTSALIKSFK